ncbi:hypothetical protein HK101_003794 [Irineochytrium annulatum]|nr:hypothetical protein HK101_003794 [Irineochytrium annulatum]
MAGFATKALHADQSATPDISPPIHVSTTYQYPSDWNEKAAQKFGLIANGNGLATAQASAKTFHIYSRDSIETRDRVEQVLGALESGHAVTYATGLAAINAAFNYYQPQRVIISKEGYHGTHGVLEIFKRGRPHIEVLHLEELGTEAFRAGDLIWLESPQNPRGECYDVEHYKSRCPPGAYVGVDSTFAPPPLQYCLKYGADMVMHSSTKFMGGHSDMLGGVLVVKESATAEKLKEDRMHLGSVMGNFECWLLLRSLRSLEVRVLKQSATATALAKWLNSGKNSDPCLAAIARVWHGSISTTPGHDFLKRVGAGYSGVLAIEFATPTIAWKVVSRLKYFKNATSLGGVESLIEWRAPVDPKIDKRVCRVSIGLEALEDLQADLRQTFLSVLNEY